MPATKRRPSPTWRQFEKAVAAEVERRLALRNPITFRNLTIDFEGRTVSDGRRDIQADSRYLILPIVHTEQILWPRPSRVGWSLTSD